MLSTKYEGHLDQIKPRLSVIDNFLSHETCDALVKFAESTPHGFLDRSVQFPNVGVVKGDVGKYNSCRIIPEYYPDLWKEYIKPLSFEGFPVSAGVLNKYEAGEFLPPHKDKLAAIYTVTIPLQDEPGNRLVFGDPNAYYDNIPLEESDSNGLTISYPDCKGTGYCFYGNEPVHWVPPVVTDRYSMLCFFGSRVAETDL
jgi:hypothetical protein